MPTGIWGFLSFLVFIVIVALATGYLPNATGGSWFGHSPVVSLVCTGGELTRQEGNAPATTDRNPGLSMTLHLDTHLVQVHVSGNQPIEAAITETEDDVHFDTPSLRGDINRLTGMSSVQIKSDDGQWNWEDIECTRRSQKF